VIRKELDIIKDSRASVVDLGMTQADEWQPGEGDG